MSLKNWVKVKQATRAEHEDFLKVKNGVTDMILLAEVPAERTAYFDDGPKEQYVFAVEVDGERKSWSRTKISPFTNRLIDLLAKAPIKISVVCTGKDKDTRYDIVENDEN